MAENQSAPIRHAIAWPPRTANTAASTVTTLLTQSNYLVTAAMRVAPKNLLTARNTSSIFFDRAKLTKNSPSSHIQREAVAQSAASHCRTSFNEADVRLQGGLTP